MRFDQIHDLRPTDLLVAIESQLATIPEYTRLQKALLAAQAESARLATDLAQERAISARFLKERDEGISAMRLETNRLAAELATERAIVARLFQERNAIQHGARQHLVLSSHIGEYTSECLDAKSVPERAALLASIRSTTKMIWDHNLALKCGPIIQIIRTMMAEHGFVFRDVGEGKTDREGYVTNVPLVPAVEQLERLVRWRRVKFGADQWYLLELKTVMHRIGEYLEKNP